VVGHLGRRVGRGRADAHRLTGHRQVVLDRDGDAGERQRCAAGICIDPRRLFQSAVGSHLLEGAYRWIVAGDAVEGGPHCSDCGEVTPAYGVGGLGSGRSHGRTLSRQDLRRVASGKFAISVDVRHPDAYID